MRNDVLDGDVVNVFSHPLLDDSETKVATMTQETAGFFGKNAVVVVQDQPSAAFRGTGAADLATVLPCDSLRYLHAHPLSFIPGTAAREGRRDEGRGFRPGGELPSPARSRSARISPLVKLR